MKEVPPERTGWRDHQLSLRHRLYGFDVPMVDIDFLVVEYGSALPRAIVEYKNERAKPQQASHPSYRALKELADRAAIPFIVFRYGSDFSWWRAIPLNQKAKEYLPDRTLFDERGFVELLYKLRGIPMPNDLFDDPF